MFSNGDQTAHTATSTATPAAIDTGTLMSGQSKTISFKHPGTYYYYCQFHAFMRATIVVK
jgi:plastocyanin